VKVMGMLPLALVVARHDSENKSETESMIAETTKVTLLSRSSYWLTCIL
jgi:hypothetical protein